MGRGESASTEKTHIEKIPTINGVVVFFSSIADSDQKKATPH